MNWPVILRNQWFQLCLLAALCSAGAGIFDLATMSGKTPLPFPTPNPRPSVAPTPMFVPTPALALLHPKKAGHWVVDAMGGADSDSRNLYQVVSSAGNGDSVSVRPGNYECSLEISKDLTLVGEGTASPLLFLRQDRRNVILIQAGHVTLSNLRLEQQFAGSFATVYCGKQSRLELIHCSVISKGSYNLSAGDDAQMNVRDSLLRSSEIGYGIFFNGRAHGTVTRSNISGNKFGLEVQNQSRVDVDGCTFQNNGDQNGYGTVVDVNGSGATLTVERSQFAQNTAGLYAQESGNLTMTGCTLDHNGISLEGDHVTGGLICVETAAQATLVDLTCKANKQGISVWTGGKAQLNNVSLSGTGIITNNTQYQAYCNAIYLVGDGTTAALSGCTISDSEYNGVVVVNGARATVEKSSVSNAKGDGLAFGSSDGTPGSGTVTDVKVFNNHVTGILVQSKSSLEVNGGEISNNLINGVEVDGSVVNLSSLFIRNHPQNGMIVYSGGTITGKRCTIEKNRFGIQAGLPDKAREFGGTIVLESSIVQDSGEYGAISCAGSLIKLTGNRFQNGRNDYLREAGGIIQKATN